MLISMLAWVLRFALFGIADNSTLGFSLIISSCIIYGMAFDFFNISGALFVEQNTDSSIQSSAQGVFMLMTNGFGAVLGNIIAGFAIKNYFTLADNSKDWPSIWIAFALYSLIVTILFALLFRHKHDPNTIGKVSH